MSPHRKNPKAKREARADKAHARKVDPGVEKLEAEVERLQAEVKTLNDKLLRAVAETENTRRRAEKDVQDMRAYAVTGFARDMLTVADNFQRALGSLSEDARGKDDIKPFVEGVEMTWRELENILQRHGIRKISPKGEPFDHDFHQAMFEVETGEADPGTVVQVVQDGYVINNRLLRPAMVGVAKAPAKKNGEDKKSASEES